MYVRKLKFIKPRKDKDYKIQNCGEQAVVMGPLHALPPHHLFTPLKIPAWNFLLPIAQELTISCQLGAHEGCELVGAIAGNLQNPEERKETRKIYWQLAPRFSK